MNKFLIIQSDIFLYNNTCTSTYYLFINKVLYYSFIIENKIN